MRLHPAVLAAVLPVVSALAQQPQGTAATTRTLSNAVKQFVSVDAPIVALTHVRLVDGTGSPARDDQTVIIEGENIRAVGGAASTPIPANAQTIDLTGHTVIPGLIGLHDHMYYSSAVTGSMKIMTYSYPKLFLAQGLTTI